MWIFLKIAIVLLCLVVIAAIVFPVYACAKCVSLTGVCLSNLKQQALGQIMYADDYDARFTPRDVWMDGIAPYVKQEALFHDPELPKGSYGYAFNGALSMAKVPKHPETMPLVYDSVNPLRNASDLVTSLPNPGRHKGRNGIAYADGHAKMRRMP